MKNKMDASCRVAFAAYLHDLGKLAERAQKHINCKPHQQIAIKPPQTRVLPASTLPMEPE